MLPPFIEFRRVQNCCTFDGGRLMKIKERSLSP